MLDDVNLRVVGNHHPADSDVTFELYYPSLLIPGFSSFDFPPTADSDGGFTLYTATAGTDCRAIPTPVQPAYLFERLEVTKSVEIVVNLQASYNNYNSPLLRDSIQ